MSDAPERIWAFYAPDIEADNPKCTIVAGEHAMHGAQPYIRADLAAAKDAEIARLREALEKCARPDTWHVPCGFCGPHIKEAGNYIARVALREQTP